MGEHQFTPEGLPKQRGKRGPMRGSDLSNDGLMTGPDELAHKLRKPHKGERGIRDWQTTGITARNVQPFNDLEAMALRQMAVWEARIEDKRYDELANGVRDLEDGLTESQTYFNEMAGGVGRADEARVDELRAHIKARLKLHRAYGIWKDHAHDSMEDIREALDKAEVKLDGEWFDTLLNNPQIKTEFGRLMVAGARPDFTDDQMIENLQQRIAAAPNGTADQSVAFTRLAWEMFTITAAAAEMGDPNIDNATEFRGVKKVMNPRRGVYEDRGLSGTVNPVEFALLDNEVQVIELHNEAGAVVGFEGRRLNGELKTIADYLGVHNFWLFLSEYEDGRFWTEQNNVVLQQVIGRHIANNIFVLNPDGSRQLDGAGQSIPVPVPVDTEDLQLIDWDNVFGHDNSNQILMGEAFAKWLDYCRKSEWSRKYVGQDILPNLANPETMQVIAEVAGEVAKVKKEHPLFQRHVPFDRKIALVDTMKGWVAERFIRIIEQGLPRDVNLQKTLNQAIYAYGGDAGRLRQLYTRSFSNESLNKEPISIAQAATYLRMIYADQNPIDFDGYPAFQDPNFPDPMSLRQVLERAARGYGWEPDPAQPNQTFYSWLEVVRNDPRFVDQWSWRVDQKNALYSELQTNLAVAVGARDRDGIRNNTNLLILMGHYIEPIYQFSAFQRDYLEFTIRDAIGYFKTDETHLYDRFVQHELIYRAALQSLRRFTPNDSLPGDRLLETVAGAIIKSSPWDEKYAPPADRDATNHPVWLEGDDRRRLIESIMMGADGYINKRYTEKDFNMPRHPKTKALLQPWQLSDNCEDRGAVVDVFERKGRVGEGFLKPNWLTEIRKVLHCTSHEVSLHQFWRKFFSVKDETIESLTNPLAQTAKGLFAGLPFGIGTAISKAQELGFAPMVLDVGEVLTYGSLAIPLADKVIQFLGWSNVTLPGNFLANLSFNPSTLPWVGGLVGWIPVVGNMEYTFVAFSLSGVLGAIINRKLIKEQIIHRVLRTEWFKKIPVLGMMNVKESLNVNRNDDIQSILKTRGL